MCCVVRFAAGRRRYLVQFGTMIQVNEETGNRRPVMLSVLTKSEKEAQATATKEQPATAAAADTAAAAAAASSNDEEAKQCTKGIIVFSLSCDH